jgi:hypothetical protein
MYEPLSYVESSKKVSAGGVYSFDEMLTPICTVRATPRR